MRGKGELHELKETIKEALNDHQPSSKALVETNILLNNLESQNCISEVTSFPRIVSLNLTDKCNARCRFCCYFTEKSNYSVISTVEFKRLDWLRFVETLRLHGGYGEPFTHSGIAEIIEYCKEEFPFLKTGVTTNGSLLNKRLIKSITDYMSDLVISLNAARRETYERIMPPLKWDKTVANLLALKEEKDKRGAELPYINFSYVVHKENIEELIELPALASSLGVGQISVNHYNPSPSGAFPAEYNMAYHKDLYNRVIKESSKECVKYNIMLTHPPLFDKDEYGASREFWSSSNEKKCFAPWTSLFVNHKFKTFLCCNLSVTFPRFTVLEGVEFHEKLWNKPSFVYMRKHINSTNRLPSCTLCMTTDTRNPNFQEKRKAALEESERIIMSC